MYSPLGLHILAEYHDCPASILDDVEAIERVMVEAANRANATIVNINFHHFSPIGVSGVIVIQESHLTIHTWPERGYAAVDIFTCGDEVSPWVAYEYLKEALGAGYSSAVELKRGMR